MNYEKPGLHPITYDFDNAPQLGRTEAYITLSRKDVLGIVQSAFDELGPQNADLKAVKQMVLDEVAEGRLAHALRGAIVGAGKARPV
jgi:hypothetical protein